MQTTSANTLKALDLPRPQEAKSVPIRFVPLSLRPEVVPLAVSLLGESFDVAAHTPINPDPLALLGAPNSVWLAATSGEEVVGIVGYHTIYWPDGAAEIFLGVVPKWRGKGVSKLMCRYLTEFAFNDLGLRRLTSSSLVGSKSEALAKQAGGVLEAIHKASRLVHGQYVDASTYVLFRKGG